MGDSVSLSKVRGRGNSSASGRRRSEMSNTQTRTVNFVIVVYTSVLQHLHFHASEKGVFELWGGGGGGAPLDLLPKETAQMNSFTQLRSGRAAEEEAAVGS